jgi:hypothetical protein
MEAKEIPMLTLNSANGQDEKRLEARNKGREPQQGSLWVYSVEILRFELKFLLSDWTSRVAAPTRRGCTPRSTNNASWRRRKRFSGESTGSCEHEGDEPQNVREQVNPRF